MAGQEEVTTYRGVHCQHPALAEARAGRAGPGDVNGTVTPEQHNDGGYSDQSPYTSWTRRKEVADYYARRRFGGQGVILTKTVNSWELVPSPDRMGEGEVFSAVRWRAARWQPCPAPARCADRFALHPVACTEDYRWMRAPQPPC